MLVGRLTNEEKGQRGYVTSGPDAVKEMEGCDGIGRRPGMACLVLQPEGPARAEGPASAKARWWRTVVPSWWHSQVPSRPVQKACPPGKRGRSRSWLGVSWGATVPPLALSSGDSLQAHLLCEGLVTFLPEPVCLLVLAGDGLEE